MHPLRFDTDGPEPFRVLCLGAHCDDIEIGCGATILRLAATVPNLEVRWVVFTGSPRRHEEARRSARLFLAGVRDHRVDLHSFRESFLPAQWGAVKEEFERIKAGFQPSLILTHAKDDAHQDHRTVAELTWNSFRDHPILEYEIPKYEGDLGNPNLLVPVDRDLAERKVAALLSCFESQRGRAWFDAGTFLGLMRLRGVACNAPFAEGFLARKLVV
ncbi:MAG: PIG-L deacetylase family protein [Pseudomonadota bacterium]